MKKNLNSVEWILRIGIFGEFLGHGIFALGVKTSWLPYFAAVGIPEPAAITLMPIIGVLDIIVALLVLIRPFKFVLGWAVFWGFLTALMRPISGEPIWDFMERWANWAAPLALLYIKEIPRNIKGWFEWKTK